MASALQAQLRAVDADPSDTAAADALGMYHLAVGDYRQAARALEKTVSRLGLSAGYLARSLAQAYAGIGDDGNALRVLRMIGMNEVQAVSELTLLERINRDRRR